MKATRIIFVVLSILGLLTAYLFNDPAPDGITEPAKYRVLMATMRALRCVMSLAHFVTRSDEPLLVFTMTTMKAIQSRTLPTPVAEVKGSNIKSKVVEFDGTSVRLYEPITRSGQTHPGFVFIHGGGMVLGSADAYDGQTRKIAEDLKAVVISIDYRLAPEYQFPVGYNDCFIATHFFMTHAAEYGVDQRRIGIGGDSAGGYLSASVAQAIHDDPTLPDLKLQVLIYPSVQNLDLNTPSYQKYSYDFGESGVLPLSIVVTFVTLHHLGEFDPYVFSQLMANNHTSSEFKRTSVEYSFVDHKAIPLEFRDRKYYKSVSDPHVGNDALWVRLSRNLLDPRSAPLMRHDLAGLPPAYIVTCGFDILRDDGIFYKNRLEEAGVSVTWRHYESAFHGVMSMPGFQLGIKMFEEIISFVKENL